MKAVSPIALAIAMAWPLVFAGCGSGPVAGGSSMETEDIRALVTLPDGSPAAGDTVRLRPSNYAARSTGNLPMSDSVRHAVCGPDGRVVFSRVPRGEYVLEARTASGTAAARIGKTASGSETQLTGRDTATLTGFVAGASSRVWVALRGLERGAWTDDSGAFRFERVPAGEWEVVAFRADSIVARGNIRASRDTASRVVLLDSAMARRLGGSDGLVLEDFESNADLPAIGILPRHLYWYYSSDSAEGGATYSTPRLPHTGLREAVVAGSGPDGSDAAHVRFTLDPNRDSPYAQIGLTSSGGSVYLDFSDFDSLTVRLKGSGKIRIDLPSRDISRAFPGCHEAWGVDLDLPSEWTRIAIRKQDLSLPTGGCATGSGLGDALAGVDEIRLQAVSDADLRFDDLRIHGVGANQF